VNKSKGRRALKMFGHVEPMTMPNETTEILKRPLSHQFNVIGLNIFIS